MIYKKIIIIILFFPLQGLCATKKEFNQAYALMIEKTKREPTRENIMHLASEIALSVRYAYALDEEGARLNSEAITEVCKLPGHARYFADEISREQQAVKDAKYWSKARNDYDTHRAYYIGQILVNLPSPETIAVLGELLSDERDVPPPSSPNQDWGDPPTNAERAEQALEKVSLRVTKNPSLSGSPVNLLRWRDWYAKVKEGSIAFSFIGQKVEYRFKPDGTWDTIPITNPPDDAPKHQKTEISQGQDPKPAHQVTPEPEKTLAENHLWEWISGGLLTLVVFACWLRIRAISAAG